MENLRGMKGRAIYENSLPIPTGVDEKKGILAGVVREENSGLEERTKLYFKDGKWFKVVERESVISGKEADELMPNGQRKFLSSDASRALR